MHYHILPLQFMHWLFVIKDNQGLRGQSIPVHELHECGLHSTEASELCYRGDGLAFIHCLLEVTAWKFSALRHLLVSPDKDLTEDLTGQWQGVNASVPFLSWPLWLHFGCLMPNWHESYTSFLSEYCNRCLYTGPWIWPPATGKTSRYISITLWLVILGGKMLYSGARSTFSELERRRRNKPSI